MKGYYIEYKEGDSRPYGIVFTVATKEDAEAAMKRVSPNATILKIEETDISEEE